MGSPSMERKTCSSTRSHLSAERLWESTSWLCTDGEIKAWASGKRCF